MPKIAEIAYYNGAQEKIARLGMTPLFDEVRQILTGFQLYILEQRDSNGGAAIREMIDAAFISAGGWTKKQTGDVDWTKCLVLSSSSQVCIGVEVQISGRSDLLIIDVVHLRDQITGGHIDIGIIVVPSDHLAPFLTDRGPNFSAAKQAVLRNRAEDLPLAIISIDHDGSGPALPKRRTRQGRQVDVED